MTAKVATITAQLFFATILLSTSSFSLPTAAPVPCSDQPIQDVYSGLYIMLDTIFQSLYDSTLPNFTDEEIERYEVICFLFNQYLEFSRLVSETNSNDTLHAVYSANQIIALKLLNDSACDWVEGTMIDSNNSASNCSLESISQTCISISFNLYKLRYLIKNTVNPYIRKCGGASKNYPQWLNANLVGDTPTEVKEVVLRAIGCQQHSDGSFVCSR